jgi:hypothetical protein
MENFSLQDLGIIVGTVSLFAVACFVMPPLLKYGPRFFVSLFRRYLWVDWDGFMSRLADLNDASDACSGANGNVGDAAIVERGQQHQEASDVASENASERASIVLRQLPKVELITMLAVQRKDDGSYLWSSNDIKKFVPGADGPIGEVIATVRGKRTPDPPARSIRKSASGEWEPIR